MVADLVRGDSAALLEYRESDGESGLNAIFLPLKSATFLMSAVATIASPPLEKSIGMTTFCVIPFASEPIT
jgi:hypothetical protein